MRCTHALLPERLLQWASPYAALLIRRALWLMIPTVPAWSSASWIWLTLQCCQTPKPWRRRAQGIVFQKESRLRGLSSMSLAMSNRSYRQCRRQSSSRSSQNPSSNPSSNPWSKNQSRKWRWRLRNLIFISTALSPWRRSPLLPARLQAILLDHTRIQDSGWFGWQIL